MRLQRRLPDLKSLYFKRRLLIVNPRILNHALCPRGKNKMAGTEDYRQEANIALLEVDKG